MNSVTGVSLPRSGHHLLMTILQCYFGESFRYCAGYYTANCCHATPCSRGATFTKSHDFDLNLPIKPGVNYLVQTRDHGSAIASDFEMAVRINFCLDTESEFVEFAKRRLQYYHGFHMKWVAPGQFTCIEYADILFDPVDAAARAINLFDPFNPPDYTRLKAIIAMLDIKPRPRKFKYSEIVTRLTLGRPR